MDDGEVAGTGANGASMSAFVQKAFPDGIASFSPSGDVKVEGLGDTGGVLWSQPLKGSGSAATNLVFHVFPSDGGFKAQSLLWGMLNCALAAHIMKSGRTMYPKGSERVILYSRYFDEVVQPAVATTGIEGVYEMLPEGPRLLSWNELSVFMKRRSDKAQERMKAAGGASNP